MHTKNSKYAPVLCLLLNSTLSSVHCFASTISSSESTLPIMVSGYYYGQDRNERPFLGLSKDMGTTWNSSADIASMVLPIPYKVGYLLGGVICTRKVCITTGFYEDHLGREEHPLLAISKDKGTTWSIPPSISNLELPSSSKASLEHGASCSGDTCIATGYIYDFDSGIDRPLLALTKDSGETWSYPLENTASALPPSTKSAGMNNPTCIGSTCMAGGYYYDTSLHPLLVISRDSGTTWNYATDILSNNNLPSPFYTGDLNGGTSCSDTTCIVTGYYWDYSRNPRPILALSKDMGATWTYPSDITSEALPPSLMDGELNGGASCSGNFCIATGYYSSHTATRPLLTFTNDGGVTWTYPNEITSNLPTPLVSGKFLGASCSGNTCVAVGSYNDKKAERPLLAVTTDSGATWAYPSEITSPVLPTSFILGQLGNVNCNGTTCIASGNYMYKSSQWGNIYAPLLAISTDSGATWSYSTTIAFKDILSFPILGGSLLGKISVNSVAS